MNQLKASTLFILAIMFLYSGDSEAQFFSWLRTYSPSDSGVAQCNGMSKFFTFVAGKVKSSDQSWDIHVIRYVTFSNGTQSGPYIIATEASEEPVALSASRLSLHFYVTALRTDSAGRKNTQMIKMNEDGATMWDTVFSFSSDTNEIPVAVSFDPLNSRLFVVSELLTLSGSDILTRSIDTSGHVLWASVFDLSSRDVPVAVTHEAEGIFIAGTSYDQPDQGRIVTIKYDTTGSLLWNKEVSDSGRNLRATGISKRSVVAVCGNDSGDTGTDIVTMLYSNNGDSLWRRTFDGSGEDVSASVNIDWGLNVIVGGTSYKDSARGSDMCILKYLNNGDSAWVNFINGPGSGDDSLTQMTVDGFSCIFVTGKCPAVNGYDAIGSALINQAGWYHWTSFVQSSTVTGDNIPYALSKFDGQNTFAISGTTFSDTSASFTSLCYLGVIDGIGNGNSLSADYFSIHTYPNPFNPSATISFNVESEQLVRLIIFDMAGRQVETLINGTLHRGDYEYVFNAANLSAGAYFARLQVGDRTAVRKMMLVK